MDRKTNRLDAASIALPGVEVRVVLRCRSTNTQLLEERPDTPVLLAAEEQTAGRGRRGRRWHSTRGRDLTFSLARRIARAPRELAALSLVAGVAAARALRAAGVAQVSLKWPNDLMAAGAKLGGILVETRSQGAASLAVIGIGINYLAKPELERRLRRPLAAIAKLATPLPSRNALIASVATELMAALDAFELHGLESVRGEWLALHAHAGQQLRVRLADGRSMTGIAAGLGEDGSLQLDTPSGLHAVHTGTVVNARAPRVRLA